MCSALNFSYHKKLGQKRAALGLRPVAAALIHLCRWWSAVGSNGRGRKRAARLASLLPPRSHHRSQVQPLISHRRKPCFGKIGKAVKLPRDAFYYGASLTTVSALLLKRLHLRVHDLGGHTLTATHANGTASNGSDGASTVPCNIVQRDTGPQSVICSCRAQHLCMSHPNSQHPEGHQPSAPFGLHTARWLRWWPDNDHQV